MPKQPLWPVSPRRLRIATALLTTCVSAAGMAAAVPPDPVDLAPRWTQGQTSRYAFTTKLEQSVEITLGDNQREQSTTTGIEGEATWVVQRVTDDGGARCTMTLDWMSLVTRTGDNETSVDSRKSAPADGKLMHDLLKAMAGVPLEIVVAPDGRVKQVQGVKAMKSRADEPDLIPDALDFEETASGMAPFAAAPRPLAAGGTWDAAFRWNHDLGHVDEDWRFRLDGVETVSGVRLATVTGTARSRLDIDPEQLETPDGTPPLRIRLDEREAEMRVLMDLSRREAVGRYSRVSERVVAEMKLPHGVFRRVMSETSTSDLIRLSP